MIIGEYYMAPNGRVSTVLNTNYNRPTYGYIQNIYIYISIHMLIEFVRTFFFF